MLPEGTVYYTGIYAIKNDTFYFVALQFYRRQEDVVTELEEMDTEHIHQAKTTEQSYGIKEFFRDKSLVKPMMVACMLQIVQQFSGINAVIYTWQL